MAAAGLSAMFFQDLFGLVTFDDRFQQLASARPRIGRSHLLYCLDLYQQSPALDAGDRSARDIIVGDREPGAQGVARAGDLGLPVSRRRAR